MTSGLTQICDSSYSLSLQCIQNPPQAAQQAPSEQLEETQIIPLCFCVLGPHLHVDCTLHGSSTSQQMKESLSCMQEQIALLVVRLVIWGLFVNDTAQLICIFHIHKDSQQKIWLKSSNARLFSPRLNVFLTYLNIAASTIICGTFVLFCFLFFFCSAAFLIALVLCDRSTAAVYEVFWLSAPPWGKTLKVMTRYTCSLWSAQFLGFLLNLLSGKVEI